MSETVRLKPNEYLMREGDESTEMYYLQSGTLIVLKRKGDFEHTIGNIIAGELVGEMSLLDKLPRSASVKAMSDCILVVVPLEKLDATLSSLPKWLGALVNTLTNRLRKANAKIKI